MLWSYCRYLKPSSGLPTWVLFHKIRAVKGPLRKWNVEVFGDIYTKLKAVKDQL